VTRRRAGNKKVANSLVALSSAAVLGVYSAGFVRTRAAAQRFAEADQRRTPIRAQAPAAATPVLTAAAPARAEAPVSATPESIPTPPAVTPALPQPQAANVKVRKARPVAASVSSQPEAPATATPRAPSADATVSSSPAPVAVAAVPDPAPVATPQPAAAPAPAVQAAQPPHITYKDGTYTGWGTSRHGDIQATVVIDGGRIASASISQCYTRYPCSWIVALPPQVAQRQSPEVDYVSGATQSTNAFYYAVVEALSKAK